MELRSEKDKDMSGGENDEFDKYLLRWWYSFTALFQESTEDIPNVDKGISHWFRMGYREQQVHYYHAYRGHYGV